MGFVPWIAIIPEYKRAAAFRLGRYKGTRGPGLVHRIPFLERLMVVDMRMLTVDVPRQECISRDNVPLTVNAVVYFKVANAELAIVKVFDHRKATLEIAQTTLRSVIGSAALDQILSDRDSLASDLQRIIDEATDEWGVKVSRVEIKDLEIPGGLKHAMAKGAEAERERRAMVIRAKGEREAAGELAAAAKILDSSPNGFQMRYLQTLLQVAEKGNSVVFAPTDSGQNSAGHLALTASQTQKQVLAEEPASPPPPPPGAEG